MANVLISKDIPRTIDFSVAAPGPFALASGSIYFPSTGQIGGGSKSFLPVLSLEELKNRAVFLLHNYTVDANSLRIQVQGFSVVVTNLTNNPETIYDFYPNTATPIYLPIPDRYRYIQIIATKPNAASGTLNLEIRGNKYRVISGRLDHNFLNQAITDAVAHNGNALIAVSHKQTEFHINNGLDKPVTIQIQSTADNVNLGSSFVVAASDIVSRVVTRETSGLFIQYRVVATCAVAPTSGTLKIDGYADIGE